MKIIISKKIIFKIIHQIDGNDAASIIKNCK